MEGLEDAERFSEFGPSGATLVAFWVSKGDLGVHFGPFGPSWHHPGSIFGVMWAILSYLGDIFGVKGGSWGALWASLGHTGENDRKSTP